MDLSPRDIQDRIRAGATPESVADAAGCDLGTIEGFVLPVMAEREHMVVRALKTRVRRKHVTGTLAPLAEVLEHVSFHAESWDSWRREDGTWTVEATHADGGSSRFRYDPKSRFVLADSPEATALIGDLDTEQDMAILETLAGPAPLTSREDDPVDTASPEAALPAPRRLPERDPIDEALEPGRQPLPGMPSSESLAADVEETIEISAPVRSLKEARDRRAMEQLTIDLELESGSESGAESGSTPADAPRATEPRTDETSEATSPRPARATEPAPKRLPRAVPDTWSEMLFGSND